MENVLDELLDLEVEVATAEYPCRDGWSYKG